MRCTTRTRAWRVCASVAVVACSAFIAAQPSRGQAAAGNVTGGCVTRFDASADYFPEKVVIEDAANFTVDYHESYKVVTVREAYAGGPPERYVLVQCGAPVPALTGPLAGAVLVSVPIRSMFAFSPTHVPLLVDLDRVDVLTGVSAGAGAAIDVERIVTAKPGLFMTGGVSSPAFAVVRSAGIPVVANTEWLERTALGRAEWLKYMAMFLNEERRAQTLYTAVRDRYRALSARATGAPRSTWPLVMTGRSTRGTFVIAGGRSYVAALIRDAGGRYVWADNTGAGSASIDLEAQIRRAGNADIWINGGGWKSLAAMLEDEPRYAGFKAYQRGQVWVYERRLTPTGANDYWSRSITHPDVVLADLVKIFHPSLVPEHGFEWYMPVPAR